MATVARSKRLALVLDLAEREKDEAAQALEKAQALCAEEQHKLAQLAEYYQDYQRDFAAATAMRVEQLIKQRAFLQQLAQAQKQQQAVILQAEENLKKQRAVWQHAHLKHKNLSELIQRYRAEEAAVADKKEQKMLDEWFQQSRAPR